MFCFISIHWNGNVVILMTFSSLATLEVVKMTTSIAASDENFIKMMTFQCQCWSCSKHQSSSLESLQCQKQKGCPTDSFILSPDIVCHSFVQHPMLVLMIKLLHWQHFFLLCLSIIGKIVLCFHQKRHDNSDSMDISCSVMQCLEVRSRQNCVHTRTKHCYDIYRWVSTKKGNSSLLAMELRLSCTNPLICKLQRCICWISLKIWIASKC